MKIRLAFALLAFTAMILACENPSQTKLIESQISTVDILSMKVSPESGPQDFTLEVTYRVSWVSGFAIPAIYCRWIGKTNNTSGVIDSIDMAMHMGIKKPEEQVRLTAIFHPAQKRRLPGRQLLCRLCHGKDGVYESSLTTILMVEENKIPAIKSVMNPPVTYSGAPQAAP